MAMILPKSKTIKLSQRHKIKCSFSLNNQLWEEEIGLLGKIFIFGILRCLTRLSLIWQNKNNIGELTGI